MHVKTGKTKALNFLICYYDATMIAEYKYLSVKILMKMKLYKNMHNILRKPPMNISSETNKKHRKE